jgi:hypothetical protein
VKSGRKVPKFLKEPNTSFKLETGVPFETMAKIYHTTRRHIPQSNNLDDLLYFNVIYLNSLIVQNILEGQSRPTENSQ